MDNEELLERISMILDIKLESGLNSVKDNLDDIKDTLDDIQESLDRIERLLLTM